MAHQARGEKAGGSLGRQREIDEGRAEGGGLARHHVVAVEEHRRADRDREPVHAGDERLIGARESPQEAQDARPETLTLLRHAEEITDVVAGREGAGTAYLSGCETSLAG
jgi:hypothetical protein